MKTTIHPDIADLLALAHELADTSAPELEFDPAELHFDFSTEPPPAPAIKAKAPKPAPERPGAGAEKISIRITRVTLATVKARARVLGMPYQTLVNQLLKEALAAS
jgi:hypothetical protein